MGGTGQAPVEGQEGGGGVNDIPFHQTGIGHQFFERTMPELVRQLARLNELLTEVVAPRPQRQTVDQAGEEDGER